MAVLLLRLAMAVCAIVLLIVAFSLSYIGKEQVLRDVSFSAKGGTTTAPIGPSGSSKTTLCSRGKTVCSKGFPEGEHDDNAPATSCHIEAAGVKRHLFRALSYTSTPAKQSSPIVASQYFVVKISPLMENSESLLLVLMPPSKFST